LSGSGGLTDQTWRYDYSLNTWSYAGPLAPSPSARMLHAMAYDAESDRVILFGGLVEGWGSSDETFVYDVASNRWTNMNPASHPAARYRAGMVYDSASDRVILFGGDGGGSRLSDTWAYDYNSNTWSQRYPSVSPSARSDLGIAYDEELDRTVVFGGTPGFGMLGDTWAYDYVSNTWTNMDPTSGPRARIGTGMAYDSESHRILLFGGECCAFEPVGETWSYDWYDNTWENLNPYWNPGVLSRSSFVYDSRADLLVLFGGFDRYGHFYGDTWLYEYFPGSGVQVQPPEFTQVASPGSASMRVRETSTPGSGAGDLIPSVMLNEEGATSLLGSRTPVQGMLVIPCPGDLERFPDTPESCPTGGTDIAAPAVDGLAPPRKLQYRT